MRSAPSLRRLATAAAVVIASASLLAQNAPTWSPVGSVFEGQVAAPPPPPVPRLPPPMAGQEREQPVGTAAIMGQVVTSGTGQALDGVRLRLSAPELRGNRTIYSDDDGLFAFANLPAGVYTLTASKTGYVGISYGQARPNSGRPGTPIQLADGQVFKDLRFEVPKGGVVTGMVFDEKNRPSVATPVRVLRWSMNNGERTLTSAGTSQTDDRGIYRVYGLAPGNYIVTAIPRNNASTSNAEVAAMMAEERLAEAAASGLTVVGDFSISMVQSPGSPDGPPDATTGYAPVYYPGTLDLANAQAVAVGVSEELTSVDFGLLEVPLARVEGQVIVPPDVSLSTITVRLYNTEARVPGVSTYSARARNGSFTFPGVVPGSYRAVATANVRNQGRQVATTTSSGQVIRVNTSSGAGRMWAAEEVVVTGADLPNVTLFLQPGKTVSGRVQFTGAAQRPSGRLRVTLSPLGQAASMAGANSRNANVDENGEFTIDGLVPAQYRVGATGGSGLTVESAMVGGLDTLDFGLEVPENEEVSGLTLTFTDQTTRLSGSLRDTSGRPTPEYMVVVFPANKQYWLPMSRRINAVRPTTTGQFTFQNLPPGDYRIAAITDVETGIWYDPDFLDQLVSASIPVQLRPGQQATQDIQVNR